MRKLLQWSDLVHMYDIEPVPMVQQETRLLSTALSLVDDYATPDRVENLQAALERADNFWQAMFVCPRRTSWSHYWQYNDACADLDALRDDARQFIRGQP